MSYTGYLFDRNLSEYFDQARGQTESRVSSIASLDDFEKRRLEVPDASELKTLALRRETARWETTAEKGGEIEVTVIVPLVGDSQLLHYAPSVIDFPRAYATLDEGGGEAGNEPTLRLTKSFQTSEVSNDLVKGWAQLEVNRIADALERQVAEVDSFNASNRVYIAELIAVRRAELQFAAELKSDLDTLQDGN